MTAERPGAAIDLAPHLFAAPAKLNLLLDVRDRRADGYHDLVCVNVSLSLVDFLRLESDARPGFHFTCNWDWLPTDERNHVVRGVGLLLGERLAEVGVRIHLHKCIAAGAGLGGGTADAAVAMVWLNDLLHLDLTRDELLALGRCVGADVPYSMVGGPALVEGTGERVTPLPRAESVGQGCALPGWVLIVDPGVAVPTAEAYALLDAAGPRPHPSPEPMVRAVTEGNLEAVCAALHNAFQPVIAAAYPPVGRALLQVERAGARGTLLAGSGSHVVGFFATVNEVCRAQDACREAGFTAHIARVASWPWAPEESCYALAQRLTAELDG